MNMKMMMMMMMMMMIRCVRSHWKHIAILTFYFLCKSCLWVYPDHGPVGPEHVAYRNGINVLLCLVLV